MEESLSVAHARQKKEETMVIDKMLLGVIGKPSLPVYERTGRPNILSLETLSQQLFSGRCLFEITI